MKFLIILALVAVALAGQTSDEQRRHSEYGYGRHSGGVHNGAGYGRRRRDANLIAPTAVGAIQASKPVDQEPAEHNYAGHYGYNSDNNQVYGSYANRLRRDIDLAALDSSLSDDLDSPAQHNRRYGGYAGYQRYGGYGHGYRVL